MTHTEYQQYLASREWAILKRELRIRSDGKCERCKIGLYEETHHLTYERIGHEDLDDLQAVCADCHKYLSAKSDFDPLVLRDPETADYFVRSLAKRFGEQYDLSNMPIRAACVLNVLAFVAMVEDRIQQYCLIRVVAEVFRVPESLLFERMKFPIERRH